MLSDKKIFFNELPYISLCKGGGAIFGPRDIIWTDLEKVHQVMLQTKYQALGLVVSDKKIFLWFSLYKPM